MEEIFTSHSDHCTSDRCGQPAVEILPDGSLDESFERKLERLLEQQLVQPQQETINRILCFSKSL